jgi:3',5'-cyclic AMP phosphodiesterase CpdA
VPLESLLLAGDIAYDHGSLEEFEENFFAPYQDLLRIVPVFAAPGNHDYETRDGEPFRRVFALPEPAWRPPPTSFWAMPSTAWARNSTASRGARAERRRGHARGRL